MSPSAVFDHVAINVRERLDEAVDTFTKLGFSLTPRGYHSMGSANHLAIFGTDYLELLGLPPNLTVLRREVMEWPCGINGLVFATEDIECVERELATSGVPLMPPRSFSRPVALAGGRQEEARFRTLTLDRSAVDYGRIYFCQHYTRHLVWRDEFRQHPNGVLGIVSVVISAQNPAAIASVFRKMFGDAAIQSTAAGFTLGVALGQVEILHTTSATARFGKSRDREDETYMKALVLRTRSLERTRKIVSGMSLDMGSRLVVQGDKVFDTAIEFVECCC
jgi:hypothetical protein